MSSELSLLSLWKRSALIRAMRSSMMRDPEMFPDPDTFRPERFLETDDPKFVDFTLPFGFGRRHCPGMHIAQQSMFIVLSRYVDNSPSPLLPSPPFLDA